MRLIDADALIENCKKYLNALNPDREVKEFARIYWLIGVLENAPTIEPEQKKGRWVAVDRRYVKCSECGLETTKNEIRGIALFGEDEPYFCPNCGADMRGGGTNE